MPVRSFRSATRLSALDRHRPSSSPSVAVWALALTLLATAAAGQPAAGVSNKAAAPAPAGPSTSDAKPQAAPPSTPATAAPGAASHPAGSSQDQAKAQAQANGGGQPQGAANKAAVEPLAAAGWGALYLLLVIAFCILSAKSDLLRSGPPPNDGGRRPFSLARCQAAWWLFIVLGSYLLIGVMGGGYLKTINATALVLMGISAGVTVAAATVDSAQQAAAGQVRRQTAIAAADNDVQVVQNLVQAYRVTAATAKADADAAVQARDTAWMALQQPPPGALAQLQTAYQAAVSQVATTAKAADAAIASGTAAEARLADKVSRLKAARNETETFWVDILSDADGVTVHRFQNVVWTVVLGFVFVIQACTDLVMPVFDSTLLALMGISAGTYVGMKIPEAKVPSPS
jgi:hypothetical protein